MLGPSSSATYSLHSKEELIDNEQQRPLLSSTGPFGAMASSSSPIAQALSRYDILGRKKRLARIAVLLLIVLFGFSILSYEDALPTSLKGYKPSSSTLSRFSKAAAPSPAVLPALAAPATPPFFIAPEDLASPPEDSPPTGYVITPERRIPPIVHYVFGMTEDFGGKPFGFIQYTTFASAIDVLKPEKIMFWHIHLPTTWWFKKIVEYAESKGVEFQLQKARDMTKIFGNDIWHYAHKADVIRLEAVRENGGIYLDTDTFVINDFAPLYQHSAVMGMESTYGLCNAVIVAQPFAPFINRWLDQYKDFHGWQWNTHSVERPWLLARQYPYEVTVLNNKAMFYPLFEWDDLELVYRSTDYDFATSGQFAYHGWESRAWDYIKEFNPEMIYEVDGVSKERYSKDSAMKRLFRKHISEDFRAQWREAVAQGLVNATEAEHSG